MAFLIYLAKRVSYSVLILIGLSMLIFVISRVMPGDPARIALGARAPEEIVQRWRDWMHLDDPLYVQYYYWISSAIRGDLGISLYSKRNVTEDVKKFLPASMELVIFSGLIMTVFGISLGVISARYKGKAVDHVLRIGSYAAIAIPPFVQAIILLVIFGYVFKILPTMGRLSRGITPSPVVTGMMTIDSLIAGNWAALFDTLKHMLMPAFALALGPMSQELRITRSSMADNIMKDYIALVKTQGMPKRLVYRKYLLKPSLIATVSILGLDFSALLANAFLVEQIFNWPGLSRYGIQTMLLKDLNAISAVVMIIGAVFITMNVIVDITIAYIDPRIRIKGR